MNASPFSAGTSGLDPAKSLRPDQGAGSRILRTIDPREQRGAPGSPGGAFWTVYYFLVTWVALSGALPFIAFFETYPAALINLSMGSRVHSSSCGIGFLAYLPVGSIGQDGLWLADIVSFYGRNYHSILLAAAILAAPFALRARKQVPFLEIGEHGLYLGTRSGGRFFAWEDLAFIAAREADKMLDLPQLLRSSAPPGDFAEREWPLPSDSDWQDPKLHALAQFTRFQGVGKRMERLSRAIFSPGVPADAAPANMTTLFDELHWTGVPGAQISRAFTFYRDHPQCRVELSSENNLEVFKVRGSGYDGQPYDESEVLRRAAAVSKKRQEESEKDAALIARVKADRERRRNERKK